MRLANKTALITGGNSGIGLATARLFVAEGARVAITGRNQARLEAAAKELGPNALAIVADVNDIAATESAVKQAVEKFGKLDVLFANAGIPGNTPIGETTLAAFETVIRTNITSVFFTVQAAAAHLKDGASIILNGARQSRLRRLRRQQGRRAGDVAGDGVRAVAARHSGQCRIARRHHHADLESRSADTGGGRSLGSAHLAGRSARTLRQTGRGRKDRAVPRLRRCVEYPGRGDFRRWRRDGFPRRRAGLSRIKLRSTKIINPVSAICRKIASQLRCPVPSSCRCILRNSANALNLRRGKRDT